MGQCLFSPTKRTNDVHLNETTTWHQKMRGAVTMPIDSLRCCAPSPCAGLATARTQWSTAMCRVCKNGLIVRMETGEGGQREAPACGKGGATGHRRRRRWRWRRGVHPASFLPDQEEWGRIARSIPGQPWAVRSTLNGSDWARQEALDEIFYTETPTMSAIIMYTLFPDGSWEVVRDQDSGPSSPNIWVGPSV